MSIENLTKVDGRTRLAKRTKALMESFASELGPDLPPSRLAQVRRAAELTALAEQARAKLMAGDRTVTRSDLVRLDNVARRAVIDLHLPPPGAKPAQSIHELFAEIAGPASAEAAS